MTTATAEQAILDAVKPQLYIGGEWRDGGEGDTIAVEDPATGETLVEVADAFGMPAWRCEKTDDFGRHLRHALTLDVPSLIVLPIDYSIDIAISDELGEETVIRT